MKMLGAVLALGGIAVLIGYSIYYLIKAIGLLSAYFTFPVAVKVAVPAVIAGFLLLLASIGWERYQSARKENFKEVEK
jgi:hypothetical protein